MKTLLPILLVLLVTATATAQESTRQRLTITQNGQTLVSEIRSLELPQGRGVATLDGLAPGMDVSSLAVSAGVGGNAPKILGIHWQPAVSGPASLLRAHVGKVLSIVIPDGSTREGRVRKEARLLSVDEAPLFLVDGQVYAGPVESILYPPQAVGPSPRVALAFDNPRAQTRSFEISYLTGALNWRMDYDLTSDTRFSTATLSGFATITNGAGISFPSATVELLAGDLGQPSGRRLLAKASAPMLAMQEDTSGVLPEQLFEHHVYKLPGQFTLPDQGQTRLPLAQADKVAISKNLVARASAIPTGRSSEPAPQSVQTLISFRNIRAEGLGQPMPKGAIRVYQIEDGVRRLVGESSLDRIPAGAAAEIALGQAFDVTIERTAKSYERTGKNSFKGSWELAIRNAKKEAITLLVQENFPGAWKITESSQKPSRSTARTAEFTLSVPPTGEGQPKLLTYAFTVDM